ncbi:DUF805 domain-containing protein [Vibrio sp. CAIM 722]|uniref:DUF805 domain-containing protein n=1 Tax=Vibrio eleionomae TaxID=2653505 RepID=A0A7X4LLS2_9VIBR|nr:DUF805 domain-containing protein [Vibrio eleionomae]MZI94136.1 DUF805 domain-containing protein [Vibrio eleionomae]
MNWYISVFKNAFNFSGRSRRKEYWMYMLFNVIVICVLYGGALASNSTALSIIFAIYSLITFIPSLSVTVRRFHDLDKSGWFILLNFIPVVGGFIGLFFMCQDSSPSDNRFGPNPKTVS